MRKFSSWEDYVGTVNVIVVLLACLTVLLFVSSYFVGVLFYGVLVKLFGVFYLAGLILILIVMRVFVVKCLRVKVVTRLPKKRVMKKFTGSSYRKVYHRRSCRFSESIKDKYFEESDDRSYFAGKKYRACGLCRPDVRKEVVSDDIKVGK